MLVKNFQSIVICLFVLLILPMLAFAGTFQQIVAGAVEPEISVVTPVTTGSMAVGKTYYWAGDGVVVPANTEGPTIGAKSVITANVTSNINARILICKSEPMTYITEYNFNDPDLLSKNLQVITLYYDRDSQFGNGNEMELKDFDPSINWLYRSSGSISGFLCYSGSSSYNIPVPTNYSALIYHGVYGYYATANPIPLTPTPLDAGQPLYLAIKSDSYGPVETKGVWQVTVGLNATVVT